ncbi:hypothetical protein HY837_02170, partial [archaeon]|nr:hypothetical protein [archaeon]
ILEKLDFLGKEIEEIKEHMVDVDVILSEEERRLLDKSVKNEKAGKLISLEDLENVRCKAR